MEGNWLNHLSNSLVLPCKLSILHIHGELSSSFKTRSIQLTGKIGLVNLMAYHKCYTVLNNSAHYTLYYPDIAIHHKHDKHLVLDPGTFSLCIQALACPSRHVSIRVAYPSY